MNAPRLDRCPPFEDLEAAVQEQHLPDGLGSHLASCPRCRRRVSTLRAENELIARARSAESGSAASVSSIIEVEGYAILSELHRGGQGVVYRARQLSSGRVVALKTPLRLRLGPRSLRRFEREIELGGHLEHESIVTLLEAGSTKSGAPFFTMDLIEGTPVDRYTDERLQGDRRAKLELFLRIADALEYAHGRGVIHRDLKPSNILVDNGGIPRILDFGLAKFTDQGEGFDLTATGEFVGSLAWSTPEQVMGRTREIDARTDVYALGLILFRMLFGVPAYHVGGAMALATETILHAPPDIPAASSGGDLAVILRKALEKSPADRYPTVNALAGDCRRYLRRAPIEARRPSGWYILRRSVRRHPVAAAALLAVLFGLAGLTWYQDYRSTRLAETVARQRIESARVKTSAGQAALAEDLLWTDLVQAASPRDGVHASAGGRPADSSVLWALRELYAEHPCLRTVQAHPAGSVVLASDAAGSLIASGSDADDRVRIWSVPDFGQLASVPRDEGRLVSLAVSGTGQRLAVVTVAGGAQVLEWPSGRTIVHLEHVNHGVRFSRDGRSLMSIETDGEIHLRELSGARSTTMLGDLHGAGMDSFAWNEPAGLLAVHSLAGYLCLLRFPSGEHLDCVERSHAGQLEISGPGDWLVAAATYLYAYSVATDELGEFRKLMPDLGGEKTMALHPDGHRMASSGGHHGILMWDLKTGLRSGALNGHRSAVRALASVGGGAWIVSADESGILKLWDPSNGSFRRVLTRGAVSGKVTLTSVVFGASGALSAASSDGTVRVWDEPSSPNPRDQLFELEGISSLAFSPTEPERLVGVTRTGSILLVGGTAERLASPEPAFNHVTFSPEGGRLAAVADHGRLLTFSFDSLQVLSSEQRCDQRRLSSVAWGRQGTWIAAGCDDGRLWWVRGDSGEQRTSSEGHEKAITCAAASPTEDLIATGSKDFTVRIWEPGGERPVRVLRAHGAPVFSLCFRPDGRILCSVDRSGRILFWDPGSWTVLAQFREPGLPIHSVAFRRDGQVLAAAGESGEVVLWDLAELDRRIAGNREVRESRLAGGSDL